MEITLQILGIITAILLGVAFIVMAVTLGATYHLNIGAWSCTVFDVKQQMCVRYEYVGN